MKRWIGLNVFAVFLPCLLTGCGGNDQPLGRVTGRVTLAGVPMQAEVVFEPVKTKDADQTSTRQSDLATAGRPSTGNSDADGYFEVYFTADRPGALLGTHRVSIRLSKSGQAEGTQTNLIPAVPVTLLRDVKEGSNDYHFALTY